MYIRILEPSKTREEEEELKPRHIEPTNYDVIISDVIVSGVIAESNGDVTIRDIVDGAIARKRYVLRKQSFVPSGGSFKSLLRVCSRTFTFIALSLAIIISVSGGVFNIKLPERKSTVGTSTNLPLCESFVNISCRDFLFRSLQEFSTNILGFNEGLCLCIRTETNGDNNKRLIRRREVLHNTRIRNEGGYGHPVYLHSYPGCPGYPMPIMQSFTKAYLAGKRLVTYIFLFADLWASYGFYSDTYIVNLDYDDKFTVFYRLMYIYIYNVYRSLVSYDWATYPEDIFTEIYTLVYLYPKVMINIKV